MVRILVDYIETELDFCQSACNNFAYLQKWLDGVVAIGRRSISKCFETGVGDYALVCRRFWRWI